MSERTCSVDACPKVATRRGWCEMHYTRWRRHGDLNAERQPPPRRSLGARWDEKVDRNGPVPDHLPGLGPCWLWTAKVNNNGYGTIAAGGKHGGMVYAHRVAYELHVGPIPEGLEIDHLCRVRHCVNPQHLEPVTGRENTLRSESASAQCARQTHCIHGHEFTPENTYRPPSQPNRRMCRACMTDRDRLRRRSS